MGIIDYMLNTHKQTLQWLGILCLVAVLAAAGFELYAKFGSAFTSVDDAHRLVQRLGGMGPLAVIALMTLAVVVSPLPSAPIALASGAAYGHAWGTLYVVVGAELGAVTCFALARILGYQTIHRWFGNKLRVGLLGSQNALAATVLVSRLLPFVSFDIVSYAAGLTVLRFWRFALATLAGVIPSAFLLAHFGEEMASGESKQILLAVLGLGLLTTVPFAIGFVIRKVRARTDTDH